MIMMITTMLLIRSGFGFGSCLTVACFVGQQKPHTLWPTQASHPETRSPRALEGVLFSHGRDWGWGWFCWGSHLTLNKIILFWLYLLDCTPGRCS